MIPKGKHSVGEKYGEDEIIYTSSVTIPSSPVNKHSAATYNFSENY